MITFVYAWRFQRGNHSLAFPLLICMPSSTWKNQHIFCFPNRSQRYIVHTAVPELEIRKNHPTKLFHFFWIMCTHEEEPDTVGHVKCLQFYLEYVKTCGKQLDFQLTIWRFPNFRYQRWYIRIHQSTLLCIFIMDFNYIHTLPWVHLPFPNIRHLYTLHIYKKHYFKICSTYRNTLDFMQILYTHLRIHE